MPGPGVPVSENTQERGSQGQRHREFDRSIPGSDAVALTVTEAIDRWPELTDRSVLGEVIALSQLDGLFERSPTGSESPRPTVEFQFQHCDVPVCYGRAVSGTIDRHR